MAKTKIRVDKSYAEEKLKAQIEKGEELFEKRAKIIRERSPDTTMRTRNRDNFEVLYNQWRDFAEDKLRELFVSSHYADEFREARSSEVEYVSSAWIPGVDYYLKKEIIPKLDYLRILSQSIDQFEKAESDVAAPVALPRTVAALELPDRVTLAWLWQHVPASLWVGFLGLLLAVFIFGATVGQIEWVQKLVENW